VESKIGIQYKMNSSSLREKIGMVQDVFDRAYGRALMGVMEIILDSDRSSGI
jgi:hypothetical protein